jgi:KUP system potassium uptake protein
MSSKQKPLLGLMLGTLGIVFGDIGTSPLYALKIVFGLSSLHPDKNRLIVFGLISLLLWTVTLIVSIKYVGFVMKANNEGEGGIMALVAIIKSSKHRHKSLVLGMGLVGVALFYGDSAVTPAISVLSAVEGVQVVAPSLSSYIIPVTLVLLIGLFGIQKYGTAMIGKLFGPIMLLWFVAIGLGGAWQISHYPEIVYALSPVAALYYIFGHPIAAFVAMGAVVLAVTGAEALYADMGHFGRPPIARAWFYLVFPALALCYLGQGALVITTPAAVSNPFFLVFPSFARIPMVFLATAATLIASQSVISGTFSLTRQAIQLKFLPRMMVRQTSARQIGQIYIPFVNFALAFLVAVLVILFGSSERLAGAYGVAVSGTLAIDSILFILATQQAWKQRRKWMILMAGLFLLVDLILVTANSPKVLHGGWLPVSVALVVLIVFYVWLKGQRIATRQRRAIEAPLQEYITGLQDKKLHPNLVRIPGQVIYIGHHEGFTPSAMHTAVEELHELHEKVVIVYVTTSTAAHVPEHERAVFNELGYVDGISQVTITYGFHDSPNVPHTLEGIRGISPELDFDPHQATYFISLTRVIAGKRQAMAGWQKSLYIAMSRNALSASDYYRLPIDKTIEMRTLTTL